MSFNLIRNARVFFTTKTTSGDVDLTAHTALTTFEIQVQDGFSFSQNTGSEMVTLNEAGAAPARGQRSFNTSLEPVDWSFSTYIRPQDGGVNITAEESVLWNAMFAADAIGGSAPAWSEAAAKATLVATNSNKHQLQVFGMFVVLDGATYIIDNAVIDSATIDFGLDAIASIQWSGKGAKLRQVGATTITGTTSLTLTGGVAGAAKGKVTTAPYIANKLSTVTLDAGIGAGGTAYTVALTGGSLTISNNVTYLTPANLGVVNTPVTYFTGTRSITGTMNAYLRSGTGLTGDLLSAMLSSTSDVSPAYYLKISVGGGTSATRVDLTMPAVKLDIPTVNTEQVVSTAINFTAQGSSGSAFDITAANEITVEYYTTNAA